jgi:hypothetical protein
MDARSGPDGATLYVDTGAGERGSEGPFHTVYSDEGATRRWGYYCSNCESFVTVMDSMGRLKCPDCSNFKKPDEWDAAHE